MWICDNCWDPRRFIAISARSRELRCVECKRRLQCFLVIRKEAP